MTEITISGMRCQHCAQSVSKALSGLGLTDIEIDLEQGVARCQGAASADSIRQVIQAIGFDAKHIIENRTQ